MRKKLKRSDLATLAQRMRVLTPYEQSQLVGLGTGTQSDPFSFWEFKNNYESTGWNGGWVEGLNNFGNQLVYTGGTGTIYVSKDVVSGTQEGINILYDGGTTIGEKGSKDKPYSYQEYEALCNAYNWTGGFVDIPGGGSSLILNSCFIYGSENYPNSVQQVSLEYTDMIGYPSPKGVDWIAYKLLQMIPIIGTATTFIGEKLQDIFANAVKELSWKGYKAGDHFDIYLRKEHHNY